MRYIPYATPVHTEYVINVFLTLTISSMMTYSGSNIPFCVGTTSLHETDGRTVRSPGTALHAYVDLNRIKDLSLKLSVGLD